MKRLETIGLERYRKTYSLDEFFNEEYIDLKEKNEKRLKGTGTIVDETKYSLERIYNLIQSKK